MGIATGTAGLGLDLQTIWRAGGPRSATMPAAEAATPAAQPARPSAPEVPPELPSVHIHLLGSFRVFVDDAAVTTWPPGKARALFKCLALQRGQPLLREWLMTRFWPDAPDADTARNSLNVALHSLRRVLDPAGRGWPLVVHHRGRYQLNDRLPVWIDVEAFAWHCRAAEAAVRQRDAQAADEALSAALAVYRGPLALDDRYDTDLSRERDDVNQQVLTLLRLVGEHQFDRGDMASSAATLERLLKIEPCDEAACQLRMRALSRLGHVHVALRQYADCVHALERELKLIPSAQTVALAQAIRTRISV
jgi:DNA-binding SARP family transcriptional activator